MNKKKREVFGKMSVIAVFLVTTVVSGIILGVLQVIVGWVKKFIEWTSSFSSDSPSNLNVSNSLAHESKFEVKIVREDVRFPDERRIAVFSLKGKGTISLSCSAAKSRLRLRIRITSRKDGRKEVPVLSRTDFFGFKKGIFFYEEEMQLPYQYSTTEDFRAFTKIPIPVLLFPHSGAQTLRFEVELKEVDAKSGNIVGGGFSCVKTFSLLYLNSEKGYIDIREALSKSERKLQFANVKLAVLVSRSDGNADEGEAAKIKSFVRNILDEEDDDGGLKADFNRVIRECLSVPLSEIPRKISESCREIRNEPLADRLTVLDLLFDVVMSDGVVAGKELDILEKIADELDLDRSEYTKRRDKALPVSAYEKSMSGTQTNRLLGISEDMTSEEIRTHLGKLYREWNAKKSSSDENVRNQAKEMIKLISAKRSEFSAKK